MFARNRCADTIVIMHNRPPVRVLTVTLIIVVATVVALTPRLARGNATQVPDASTTPSAAPPLWPPAGVYRVGRGITAPRVIKAARPTYPPEAVRAKIEGKVLLELVVQPDGTVGDVRVQRSLDRKTGLDDAAVKAVKEMRFAPATKDGVAVPVLTQIELSFTVPNAK
jgi:TonB family protein